MNDSLIPLLTEIRDQQKQQIANFERALAMQDSAAAAQKSGQKFLIALLIVPWIIVLILIGVIVVPHIA